MPTLQRGMCRWRPCVSSFPLHVFKDPSQSWERPQILFIPGLNKKCRFYLQETDSQNRKMQNGSSLWFGFTWSHCHVVRVAVGTTRLVCWGPQWTGSITGWTPLSQILALVFSMLMYCQILCAEKHVDWVQRGRLTTNTASLIGGVTPASGLCGSQQTWLHPKRPRASAWTFPISTKDDWTMAGTDWRVVVVPAL